MRKLRPTGVGGCELSDNTPGISSIEMQINLLLIQALSASSRTFTRDTRGLIPYPEIHKLGRRKQPFGITWWRLCRIGKSWALLQPLSFKPSQKMTTMVGHCWKYTHPTFAVCRSACPEEHSYWMVLNPSTMWKGKGETEEAQAFRLQSGAPPSRSLRRELMRHCI